MLDHSALRELRQWATNYFESRIAGLFGWTRTAQSSTIGDADTVETFDGTDPGGGSNKSERQVTRVMPFGLISRQPKGLRGLWLKLGASNIFFLGIGPTEAYSPQNLNTGETALYATPGQTFLLDKNGNLIGLPAGAGTFQAGGNAYAMPQWDPFIAVLAACASTIAALTTATDPATTMALANGIKAAFVTLNTALSTNSNYKSTKAKNG